MKLLITIFTLIFLLALLFLTRIRIQIHYLRQGKDDELALNLSIWRGLIRYRLELPVIKFLTKRLSRPAIKIKAKLEGKNGQLPAYKKNEIPLPSIGKLLFLGRQFRRYRPAIIYLINRVTIHRFYWSSIIGLANPAQTAIAFGLLWSLKGLLLSTACRYFAPDRPKPKIVIIPSFQNPALNITIDCTFEVWSGHILITGLFALWLRFKKRRI